MRALVPLGLKKKPLIDQIWINVHLMICECRFIAFQTLASTSSLQIAGNQTYPPMSQLQQIGSRVICAAKICRCHRWSRLSIAEIIDQHMRKTAQAQGIEVGSCLLG